MPERKRSRRAAHLGAGCLFLTAALWSSRAVLRDPSAVVTTRPNIKVVVAADIRRNIAQTAYASRSLSSAPWDFFDGQMCHPTPAGVSLGEHMLGEGLLGIPVHLLWDDPVVTFNFVVAARPLIGAFGMYALVYYWTGSSAAGLIAGFLFGFHPSRLGDLVHPSVVGNELIPLVLLALHRLFARRRWRDAALLALLTSLQLVESLYVVLQLTLAVGVYGAHLFWRHRRALGPIVPKLAFAAAATGAVAVWTFAPYLETRAVWDVLKDRTGYPVTQLSFGERRFPGVCLLVLAGLGLLDRLRGVRAKDDPRLAMAVLVFVAYWFVLPLHLPGVPSAIPSLRQLTYALVPGFDAIRAPSNVFFVSAVALAVLASFAVQAVGEQWGARRRGVLMSLLVAACVGEVFLPATAARSFGAAMPSDAFRVRPADEDLAALRNLPRGVVLDLPLRQHALAMSHPVLLGAYHERRQVVCKASFLTPVQDAVEALTNRLPNLRAAQELWALGIRTLVFRGIDKPDTRTKVDGLVAALAKPGARPRLEILAEGATLRVGRWRDGPDSVADVELLNPVFRAAPVRAGFGPLRLGFGVRVRDKVFRHPEPIRPTDVLVIWRRGKTIVQKSQRKTLLPLALAPGDTVQIFADDSTPPEPGLYDITLARADDPARILGAVSVVIPGP